MAIATDPARAVMIADSALLRRPHSLGVSHAHIVVGDRGGDSLLTVFDAETHQYVGGVGSTNTGRARAFGARVIDAPRGAGGVFRVFDPILKQAYAIEPGSITGLRHVESLSDSVSPSQPMYLRDGRFISTALRIKGRFGVFAPDGRLIDERGPMPPGDDALPIYIRQHAFSARTAMHPDESRLAVATRYADHLDIYDTAGTRLVSAPRLGEFEPVYAVGERGGAPALGMRDDSRIGYITIAADSGRIFALFSGRTVGGFGPRAFDGRLVYVFTWSGAVEGALEFEDDISHIAVRPDGRRLYALTSSPNPRLLVVRLDGERDSALTARRGEDRK